MSTLKAIWGFLRELVGETALERRMQACGCASDPKKAVEAAMNDQFDGVRRCC